MFSRNMPKNKKPLVPVIAIFFWACTVIYHVMRFRSDLESTLEEDCAAQANAGGIISSQCLELDLFKDWHKKEADHLLVEAAPSAKKDSTQAPLIARKRASAMVVDEFGETCAHSIKGDLEGLERQISQLVVSGVHLDVKYDTEHQGVNNEEANVKTRWENRSDRFEELEKEVRSSLNVSPVTPWATDLQHLMDHMQHELDSHKAAHHEDAQVVRHLKEHELKAHIDKVESAVRTAQNESNSTAPWARDVQLVKSRIAYKLAAHAGQLHGAEASAEQKAKLAKLEESVSAPEDQSHDTPWAKDLRKLQHRLEFELQTHAHRHHHEEAGTVDEAARWGHSSSSNASDPIAKWANGLEDFHSTHEQFQARHRERVARRAQLQKDIAQRMEKLDHGLADIVSDRKAWESTFLEKHHVRNLSDGKQLGGVTVPKKTFLPSRLRWSDVPTSPPPKTENAVFLNASQELPVVVHKDDVRHMHWADDLPKVAAVAWIRGGRKTRARMPYFVDNFKLQDYGGRRELVLVYHFNDTAAANALRKYVNSTDIKIVTAHDFSMDAFPSDPALRYAAWSSDADVVAQWDFDEWHDPNRLSMQIRAMAYKAKRACVLTVSSTSHRQEDEDKEISLSSVVGTRTWMKAHWHPFSQRKVEASQLVEMDMQNKKMMGSISRVEHVFHDLAEAPQTTTAAVEHDAAKQPSGSAWSRDINECLGYDHSHGQAADDAAEKAIREKVGPEFGKRFHDLVKRRHDITSKLQLLCFQTSMEPSAVKRKYMHEHVLEMDHIRAELHNHVQRLASNFGVASP